MTSPISHAHQDQPATYQIKVRGRLDAGWAACFGDITLSTEIDAAAGTVTVLTGRIPDQAALHGLLARIRDLGLALLLVERLEPDG